jgi:uncharacterized protein YbjQ (UPF0145 family)
MEPSMNDLPPAAAERVRRQAESHVAGSLLSAPAHAALAAADFEPAGEVMGCIVMHLGWNGYGCGGGYYGSGSGFGGPGFGGGGIGGTGIGGFGGNSGYGGFVTPILTSSNYGSQSWRGYGPYVTARYHAYDTALVRMLTEARALGADGVVGVTLRWTSLDTGARELVAMGTAVHNRRGVPGLDPVHARTGWPFCTELSGEDVAKAVLSGWLPLGIAVGLSIAVKHHDWQIDQQTSWLQGAGNTEVDGLTQLIHAARADARHKLTERAQAFSGAAQIVVSSSNLEVGERECVNDQRDHLAEASFFATVLAHHPEAARRTSASSLSILPLRGANRNTRGGTTL